jgi:hypothetical protein
VAAELSLKGSWAQRCVCRSRLLVSVGHPDDLHCSHGSAITSKFGKYLRREYWTCEPVDGFGPRTSCANPYYDCGGHHPAAYSGCRVDEGCTDLGSGITRLGTWCGIANGTPITGRPPPGFDMTISQHCGPRRRAAIIEGKARPRRSHMALASSLSPSDQPLSRQQPRQQRRR